MDELRIVRAILDSWQIRLPDHERSVAWLADIMRMREGRPIYPTAGESLAVSFMRPKTAALAFDRVHRLPAAADPMPAELGFYCATLPERVCWIYVLLQVAAREAQIDVPMPGPQPGDDIAANERRSLRDLCSELDPILGTAPTILFENRVARDREFPVGASAMVMGAIAGCGLADENALSWDQVLEFRQDREAGLKYRRLVRWIDAELRTRSAGEVADLIATRLDDYEWSIKKHGIKTLTGSLSCLLDPKFLGGVSATVAASAVAGGPVSAVLTGATLGVGRAVVSFSTSYIDGLDARRSSNCEVAYLYDVAKLG